MRPDPCLNLLDQLLRGALLLGMVAMLSLPAARGYSAWIGWWPFWLLIAPASSLLLMKYGAFAEWRRVRTLSTRSLACGGWRRPHPGWQARRLARITAQPSRRLAFAR